MLTPLLTFSSFFAVGPRAHGVAIAFPSSHDITIVDIQQENTRNTVHSCNVASLTAKGLERKKKGRGEDGKGKESKTEYY